MKTPDEKHTSRMKPIVGCLIGCVALILVAFVAVPMTAVGIAVIPQLDQAKVDRAKMDIEMINNALKAFRQKKGDYPDTGGGLKAVVDAHILEKMPVDPWDHEYVYLNEGGKPVIMSYGKDGAPGGSDSDADISSKDTGTKK